MPEKGHRARPRHALRADLPPGPSAGAALLRRTGHMDARWYLETYPDVARLGMDPATHYLTYGAEMGRDPGPGFDTRWYLETHPGLAEQGINPLVHYVLEGAAQGDLPRPPDPVKDGKRAVEVMRANLLTHGFTSRALADLESVAGGHPESEVRAWAAREIALWHMRHKTEEGYRAALDRIADGQRDTQNDEVLRRLALSEILCHYFLDEREAGLAAWHRVAEAGLADTDVVLARLNLEPDPHRRVALINVVLAEFGIAPVTLGAHPDLPAYDRLAPLKPPEPVTEGPLVTVLVAAYKAADTLPTALRSIVEQSWRNLEILVIDDASPDGGATRRVARDHAARDPRIRLIELDENMGAYVARNCGLDEARGSLVTLHDADDWSHPQKIETQVRHLTDNPEVIGCTTDQARATSDLTFTRWTGRGEFLIGNTSSFMFRREIVQEHFGYWDTVRFSADNELIRRIRHRFGSASVAELKTGPFSFQRDSDTSIIASGPLGINGFLFGVRQDYFDAQRVYREAGGDLKFGPDPRARPFPVPVIMRPERRSLSTGGRHFDLILGADPRWSDDVPGSCAAEISVARASGLRVGLAILYRYALEEEEPYRARIRDELRREIDGEAVQMIAYGEEVSCDLLVLRDPRILQDRQRYVPRISAGAIRVIADRPAIDADGLRVWDPATCLDTLRHHFGASAIWHPTTPAVRSALVDGAHGVEIAPEDWPETIDPAAWARSRLRGPEDSLRIGRYSGDIPAAWSGSATDLRAAYPGRAGIEVHVMGGARTPSMRLGGLPENWVVHPPGAMPETSFLQGIDAFVWLPRGTGAESPIRPPLEAMAAGVPVIAPPVCRSIFGDGAVYAAPGEMPDLAAALHADPIRWADCVARARAHLRQVSGPARYRERLRAAGLVLADP